MLDTTGWLPIIGWRVWLADGRMFSSKTHVWENLPDEIQIMCFYHVQPYKTFVYGVDEYEVPESSVKKKGEWMDTDQFYELVRNAEQEEWA